MDLEFFAAPFTLDIRTWNTSTTTNHTCTICFFLDTYAAPRGIKGWLSRLLAGQPEEEEE